MDIGSLTGSVSIDDQLSSVLTLAADKVKSFADEFDGMTGLVIGSGAVAVSAIVAITAAVTALAVEGSEVNEVTAGFDRMAGSIENATIVLEAMQVASIGTVNNLQLMTDANKLMASGVDADAQTMGTLTQYAMVLSNEGFGPLATTMDMVSTAMERGTARGGPLKGAIADVTSAENAMSSELALQGLTLDRANKLIADRQGLLQYMSQQVESSGDQELSFAKKIDQGVASLENWLHDLESAVASSPALSVAYDGIAAAFTQAFGSDKQAMITTIVGYVNSFASASLSMAEIVVTTVGSMGIAWNAFKVVMLDVAQVIDGAAVAFEYLALGIANGLNLITGGSFNDSITRIQGNLTALMVSMTARAAAIAKDQQSEGDWAVTIASLNATLETAKTKLDALTLSTTAGATAASGFVGPINQVTTAQANATAAAEAHQKAVDTLVISLVKSSQSASVTSDAFNMLTPELLSNKAVIETLTPLIDKLIAQGTPLTSNEIAWMDAQIQSTAALTAKNQAAIANLGVTTQQIQALKDEGLSETQIAYLLGLTTVQYKLLETEIKARQSLEETSSAAVTKLWSEYASLVGSETNTAYQTAGAAIDKWAADAIAQEEAVLAKSTVSAATKTTIYKNYVDAISALEDQKYNVLNTQTLAADTLSQQYYKKQMDAATSYYAFLLNMQAQGAQINTQSMIAAQAAAGAAQIAYATWTTGLTTASVAAEAALDKMANDAVTTFASVGHGVDDLVQKLGLAEQAITSLTLPTAAGAGQEESDLKMVTAQVDATGLGQIVKAGTTNTDIMNQYEQAIEAGMAALGYSASAIGMKPPSGMVGFNNGPNGAAFAEGGIVTVGENGPERVALPYGSTVYPTGTGPDGGAQTINLVVDGKVLASVVAKKTIQTTKQNRLFQ